MKENLRFKQSRLNYITKKNPKKHMRLVIDSTGVHVVVKIVDEIYVLSTFEIYSYFSFAFSIIIQNIL